MHLSEAANPKMKGFVKDWLIAEQLVPIKNFWNGIDSIVLIF